MSSTSIRSVVAASTALLLPLLGGCSDEVSNTGGGVVATTEPSSASPTDPVTTAAPTSTATKPNISEGEPATESVSILVDADSGETQDVSVALGTPMTIRIRSTTSEEFHLHGYDLELTGTDVTFTFVADKLGDFELETHGSGALILLLSVLED